MKQRIKKGSKKKNLKKRKNKTHIKKNSHGGSIDFQNIMNFKFQTFGKAYKNFKECFAAKFLMPG